MAGMSITYNNKSHLDSAFFTFLAALSPETTETSYRVIIFFGIKHLPGGCADHFRYPAFAADLGWGYLYPLINIKPDESRHGWRVAKCVKALMQSLQQSSLQRSLFANGISTCVCSIWNGD